MNQNGTIWSDTQGNLIQAHGGMILKFKDRYYWYGENKDGPTFTDSSGNLRVDFLGFSCYSSWDCMNWKNEGLVLSNSDDPSSDLYKGRVGERPRVLYNSKNNNFVLWFHLDSADYTEARAGIAVSQSPTGPFQYLGGIHPNKSDCRDLTLFQDHDGLAYLIHSSDWNKTLRISQLTDDYLNVNGLCALALVEQEREAPALFFHNDVYYMITSGCTGWEPNSALTAVSDHLLSGWKLTGSPCVGARSRQTFAGQGTCIFQKGSAHYLMLDHWNPKDLRCSGYSILPLKLEPDGPTVSFQDYTVLG